MKIDSYTSMRLSSLQGKSPEDQIEAILLTVAQDQEMSYLDRRFEDYCMQSLVNMASMKTEVRIPDELLDKENDPDIGRRVWEKWNGNQG